MHLARSLIPEPAKRLLRPGSRRLLTLRYRCFGRPVTNLESAKAHPRRQREGFFERFCTGWGLDIGFGGDLVVPNASGWDIEHGDAQYLTGVIEQSFDFVHSSHTLEHMIDPEQALLNWWRVLKPGGHLILYVPDRDLYEKREVLPSRWNADHKHFFLLHEDDPPHTIGLVPLVRRTLPSARIVYAKECSEGHTVRDPLRHSDGEYSLEVVVEKPLHAGTGRKHP